MNIAPDCKKKLTSEIQRWRRELHQIPEIGPYEFKTAEYLRNELKKMGFSWQEIFGTGTIIYLDNDKSGTLAFRADIDGLAVQEETGVEFTSQHAGTMHACGHDGHMAGLLGFAWWLKDHFTELDYNILLIFQPAEETIGGAKEILASGVFEKYNVEAIYGLHLFPDLPEGVIGCRPGPLMAQIGDFEVVIEGKSAHSALAYQGIDSLYIATQLVQQYQGILPRYLQATDSAVLHVGTLQAGETPNVVAAQAVMKGNIRVFEPTLFGKITDQMRKLHQAAELAYGCQIKFDADPGYPPVLNGLGLTQKFAELIANLGMTYHEFPAPFFLGEDFSYYQEAVPGVFFYVGIRNEEKGYTQGLHNSRFNFDESALFAGVEAFIGIAKNS